MCNELHLPPTGTKHEMVTKILLTKNNLGGSSSALKDSIHKKRLEIRLTLLRDGHFLYPEPNLVFHQQTRRVFCRHEGDATDGVPKLYSTLRDVDIEYCKQYKLPYDIPEDPVQVQAVVPPPDPTPTPDIPIEPDASDSEEEEEDPPDGFGCDEIF